MSELVPVLRGATADSVWRRAAEYLRSPAASAQPSRNGPTREILHAMMVVESPRERWVWSRKPSMNPAFALAEVIWILGGRRDAKPLNFFNPALPKYAGYGETYHGAYGNRLRRGYGLDQLTRAAAILRNNPDSRQVVLQIWDPRQDLPTSDGSPASADVPCNVTSLLKIREGHLHWTQVLRSNDLFLGVPHNFVQFTYLQEVLAGWIGVEVGPYVHISDSLHVYERDLGLLDQPGPSVDYPRNEDSVAVDEVHSVEIWTSLNRIMDRLTADNLSPKAAEGELDRSDMPQAFRNIAAMLVADAARRRKWRALVQQAVENCMNPSLRLLWKNWDERVSKP